MEKQIKEVQDYFKKKILDKDFETVQIKEHSMLIKIDKKYDFSIWIGNMAEYPETVKLCNSWGNNFMDIKFNQKESLKLCSKIRKEVFEFKNNILLTTKKEEYEKLKKELGIKTN